MMLAKLRACLALCIASLALAGAAWGGGFDGPLVSAAWLKQSLERDASALLILDASPTPMHKAGHIPGAVGADAMTLMVNDPSTAEAAARLRQWGYVPGRKLLIYDGGGSYFAPRLFHELYRAGVPLADMALLDGGLDRWKAAGGAVTQEPTPRPAPGRFEAAPPADTVRVDLGGFLAATADRANQVALDALPESHYYGAAKFFNRAGHIPTSVSWPAEQFFNADKTFKSPQQIRQLGRHLGITPERVVHTHCGGGGAAAVPFFALKFLAGYPRVTLFVGSQAEWLRDERNLPFATYAAQTLLRDADWVAGWNHRMMRAVGASRMNLLDVRPASDYAMGHLPYALSLPAEELRQRSRDPQGLAQWLAQSGVDARHEAVIVSGGGLTEAAALAYVALEQGGYPSLSLMLSSTDDWVQRGFELSKQPTEVGKAKDPTAPSVPAVEATALARRAAPAAASPLPAIHLALGAKPGAAPAADAKFVHLPYRELLDADGRPLPAAELWSRLDKAGVSRFARIVLVGPDPGPSAVGYVLLKLMGYPAVQLMPG